MPEVNFLYLAALTRDLNDAGSSDHLSITINVDGIDVAVAEFVAEHPEAQGYLQHAVAVVSFDSESLTNSSVRIGNRGDDAWAPQDILLFAVADGGGVIPIAMETDLTHWLSSDPSEGRLTLPLRLVERGDSSTLIHRLLLLVRTADEDDAGTDSPVRLQVIGSDGQLRMSELITNTQTDTPQDDLEQGVSNWYYLPVRTPFTERDISNPGSVGRIELEILGRDAWLPESLFLFGLDTPVGRPTKLVPLVSNRIWQSGVLSQDEKEGSPKIFL
jgi:hypothetical protein